MSEQQISLFEARKVLEAQDRALADVVEALGITPEDLQQCELELDQATVDRFWSDLFDLPVPSAARPRIDHRVAFLRA